MLQFFEDMQVSPFLMWGLMAGLLASVTCGIVGPYVITRRIVFLSGAIAHMAVGGLGAAIFMRVHWPDRYGWFTPLMGAATATVIGALIIGLVYEHVKERMDTLIGAMWAIGMSVGIMLLGFTPGYHTELMSYLFGNISVVSKQDVWLLAGLSAAVALIAAIFHKRLLAICLDEQQAELQGINVLATNLLLLVMVALTVICLINIVGLILVLALLTLPAATVSHHVRRLGTIMLGTMLLCAVLTTLPRVAVYGSRVSAESAIVLSSGAVYLLSVIAARLYARARRSA